MVLCRAMCSARSLASGLPSTQIVKRGPTRGMTQVSHQLQRGESGPGLPGADRVLFDWQPWGPSRAGRGGGEVGELAPGRMDPNSISCAVSLSRCMRSVYSRFCTFCCKSARVRDRDLPLGSASFLPPRSRDRPPRPRPRPVSTSLRRVWSVRCRLSGRPDLRVVEDASRSVSVRRIPWSANRCGRLIGGRLLSVASDCALVRLGLGLERPLLSCGSRPFRLSGLPLLAVLEDGLPLA